MNSLPLNRICFLIGLCIVATAGLASADETDTSQVTRVSSKGIIELAMAHNLDLKIAILSEESAQQRVIAADTARPYTAHADTGYTHSSTPLGDSQYQRRDIISMGAGLSKTYNWGTTADVEVDGDWSHTNNDAVGTGAQRPNTLGLGARLTLSQPLLRGAGKRIVLADWRQARREKSLAEKKTDAQVGLLAKSVLYAYWSLWLSAKSVEVNQASVDVAKQQLEETRQRIEIGDTAQVELIAFQTRLATLEETLLASKASMRQNQMQLSLSVGTIRDRVMVHPDTEEALPLQDDIGSLDVLTKEALTESPDVAAAFAALELAKERAEIAGEAMRQRLDLSGWIEARTQSGTEYSPVVTDLKNSGAYSGYIGIQWEFPLDDRKKKAERAAAKIAIETAAKSLQVAEDTLRGDLAMAEDQFTTSKQRSDKARETLELAEKQLSAERERYRLGATIFTVVRDAEETVREAKLRLLSTEVDRVKAQIEIDYLTGRLLASLIYR